jgi:hypothetical protein
MRLETTPVDNSVLDPQYLKQPNPLWFLEEREVFLYVPSLPGHSTRWLSQSVELCLLGAATVVDAWGLGPGMMTKPQFISRIWFWVCRERVVKLLPVVGTAL